MNKNKNKNKNISGTYYIRVRKTGWYLYYQSFEAGKRQQEPVDSKAFATIGFKKEMSTDEAKARCQQINKERNFLREKIRVAAKRVTELKTIIFIKQ